MISISIKQDSVATPAYAAPVVPVVTPAPRRTINPLIPLCAVGLILFLIATTIVLSLIPVYLQRRDVDRRNIQSNQFTVYLALRNGYLPVGPLSAENCAIIQDDLRRRAQASSNVNPAVPTVTSCTVTGNDTTTGKRKKRQSQIQSNQIALVVILSPGNCLTDRCSSARARNFINLLLGAGEFTLNLVLSNGSRFNFVAIYTSSSAPVLVSSSPTNPDLIFYGVTQQNQLLRINTQNPANVLSTVTITGLKAADTVMTLDFRPATGQLYGTSNNQLYVINEDTGVARAIGAPLNSTNGNINSMEINPALDVLRIVTETGTNLRIDPETGEIISTDSSVSSDTGTSVAFNNNLAGTSTTTLFILDPKSDRLLRQNPPTDLTITQVGSGLGTDFSGSGGFDMAPNGLAVACLIVDSAYQLYLVDVNSGTLSQKLGDLSQPILSLAIPTAPVAYAIITSNNSLLIINSLNSVLSFVSKSISGLQGGETILGLDMRPLNGQLYGLGSTSRLYTIDMGSGAATAIGSGPFTPLLSGTYFGFDFNPTVDRIRVVSEQGQNLRLNPNTGTVAGVDNDINPSAPNITAVAYTNNVANASTTVLYDIDSGFNRLYIQNPPNNGTLVDVGALGIDPDDNNGFDIGGKSGTALALFTVNGVTSVYQINLSTGAATSVSNTVFPVPIRAYTLGLNV